MPPAHYHVFLSHNSADKPAVEELARRLQREGIEPWLDSWNLIPGTSWQPALEAALALCVTCAVFIGPSGTGPWQKAEVQAAIDRRVRGSDRQFRVIPVLLPGAERGERSTLPPFLTEATWVEFRHTLDDAEAFRRLVAGIRGIEPGPDPQQAAFVGTTPYRGLHVFDVADAPFFFGREALVEWLLTALRPPSGTRTANRFLGILGPSGSGKSSLARAGLIAAITRGEIEGSEQWPVAICKPGADPLESLALAVTIALGGEQNVTALRRLIDDMRADARTLHLTTRLALADGRADDRLVVLVDQFEELWTLCHDPGLRESTIDTLLHAATVPGGQTIVILTLRADFYGKCAAYPALAAALSDHQMLVGPMTRDEVHRAIERPAQLAGAEFQPGLVETLLDDVQGQPGSLPLLQHALLELWNRRTGRKLTHAVYFQIGGVAGALEQRAEAVFTSFTPAEQAVCRRIFLRLTQLGEGTEDIRRRATRHELMPSGIDAAAFDEVLHKLADADARLVITTGTPKGYDSTNNAGREVVEVAHEAVIRSWKRLRRWIDEDRAALRVHRQLTEAAQQWDDTQRDASFLYVGARLAEVQAWAVTHPDDLNALEQSFLKASVAARDAQLRAAQRRTRRTIAGLVTALAIISVFAGGAAWFWRSAVTSDRISRARDLVAEGQNRFADRPLLGLRLALEGLAVAPTDDIGLQESLGAVVQQMAEQGRVQKLVHDARSIFSSPDGTRVAFMSDEQASKVWFVDTNTSVSLTDLVRNVTFSPDGRYFVVQYIGATPDELRRTTDGAMVTQLAGPVDEARFSPDGRYFVVGYIGDTPSELRRATDVAVVTQLAGPVDDVRFSPDGRYFVVDYAGDTPSELRRVTDVGVVAQFAGPINRVMFSSDGRYFIVDYADATSNELRHASDGAIVARFAGIVFDDMLSISSDGRDGTFSPDGRYFVVRDANATPNEVRRVTDGAVVARFARPVLNVRFSPDGRYFAVDYAGDTSSELRRAADGAVVPQLVGPINRVTFSPDGRYFVVDYAGDTSSELRRAADGAVVPQLVGPINRVTFSPDGRYFVVDYDGGTPSELRRTTDYVVVTELVGSINRVTFSPNGRYFVVDSYGDTPVELHRTTDDAIPIQLAGPVDDFTFGPYQTLLVSDSNGLSSVWNLEDRPYQLVNLGFAVQDVVIAPTAQKVVVHYQTGDVYLLDTLWLRSIHDTPTAPSVPDLIRIACTGPFKSELWTYDDQQALDAVLNGQEEQACKE